MAKQTIGLGTTDNDGLGDSLKSGGEKINDNFDEVYDGGDIDTRQYTSNVVNPPYKEGLTFYDFGKNALSYYNDESDTTVNTGQEIVIKVFNNNGSTLMNGTVVRVDAGVTLGVPHVIKSQADTVEGAGVAGVATHDILVGQTGYITLIGTIGGLDTSSFSEGDKLFLSATVAGALTNEEQQILKPVALVLEVDASEGVIIVAPQPIANITAIGQIIGESAAEQTISATPAPLGIYNNTPFEQNVTVKQDPGVTNFTAKLNPSSVGASGFYRVDFYISMGSPGNNIFTFQVYIGGVNSGIGGVVDLSNNNTTAGSVSFSILTIDIIADTDDIEIFVSSDAGTPTITNGTCAFSISRIGNV